MCFSLFAHSTLPVFQLSSWWIPNENLMLDYYSNKMHVKFGFETQCCVVFFTEKHVSNKWIASKQKSFDNIQIYDGRQHEFKRGDSVPFRFSGKGTLMKLLFIELQCSNTHLQNESRIRECDEPQTLNPQRMEHIFDMTLAVNEILRETSGYLPSSVHSRTSTVNG